MKKAKGSINGVTAGKTTGLKQQRPVIIAGPCSAESPEQLMETAGALKECGKVDYFRAGLWKPRTLPGSFEGVGSEGLKWLKMVKEETGMKVATEVGSEKHVFEALKYDIDLLWIGARTVSNPFVVQEIAESLRGVDIPVLVKNPLNPDLELWYGAINRFMKAGIREVGAIHRGFSTWGKSIYRNSPIWEIPRALKERMPGLLIICDPSHIAGKRSLVPLIAGRSIDEGLDGLMIEVHPAPEHALSDAAQQLRPQAFTGLMNDLDIKSPSEIKDEKSMIDELSSEIDMIDDLLVRTIASRMELTRQIEKIGDSRYRMTQKPILKQKTFARLYGLAMEDGLRPDFINRLFDEIERESLHIETSSHGVIVK
jgi:chorismate mutase